jgi:hypothetical protein
MINIDHLMATPGSLTMGRTYKQVLVDARNLIAVRDRWTQEAHARDSEGHNVRPRDPRARCWCLLGAVAWSSNELGIIPPPLLTFIESMVPYHCGKDRFMGPGSMNDYFNHESVLSFLDHAIDQFPKETP